MPQVYSLTVWVSKKLGWYAYALSELSAELKKIGPGCTLHLRIFSEKNWAGGLRQFQKSSKRKFSGA
jgi:hypothetical protein